MNTIMQATGLDTAVTLNAHSDSYSVVYGAEVYKTMDFESALGRFNECVVHSATCAGLLDNWED